MTKRRFPPFLSRYGSVVLIELPDGFAFFAVADDMFDKPEAVGFLEFVKVDDKSVVWRSDGPGGSIAYWAKQFYCSATRFVVGDEKLRRLLKSNLGIDCFNKNDYIVREVLWGVKHALPFLASEIRRNITISPECPLPLCRGFEDLMKKYKIIMPTEAVDRVFLAVAGSLQRVEELKLFRCTEMREACDKLVPGISGMIKDNTRYVEVMAKILTPWLVEDWDPSKWSTAGEPWFTPDEMQKIEAKDAAAGDAREKVKDDYAVAAMIKDNLHDYRCYPKAEDICLQRLRSYEAKAKRGQKRSHREMAEEEVS